MGKLIPVLSFLFISPPLPHSPIRHNRLSPTKASRRQRLSHSDMSVSVSIPPAASLRHDSDSELLLDSRNRGGKGDIMTTNVEDDTSLSSKTSMRKNRYTMSSLTCFGVELSPDNIAVAMVYFVQGVLSISRLAVSFYFKDDLHLDPAETAIISGFSSIPWLIKPLYGFISDSLPLFGYRRRSYLVLSGMLGTLSWSLMATLVDSKYSAALCILLGSLSIAFADVVSFLGLLGNVLISGACFC